MPDPQHTPSPQEPAALAREYLHAVGRKDLDRVAALLHPEVDFTLGSRSTHTRDEFVAALRRLAPILVRNDIRRVFADGNQVCAVYDFVTDTPAGPVLSVELLEVEGGAIRSSLLLFEKERWPEAMHALAARTGAGRG